MTKCNPAGGCNSGCCDPVVLAYSQSDVYRVPGVLEPENRRFVLEDLTPITRGAGLRRASYLKGGVTSGIIGGEIIMMFSFFYECRHFDTTTRECRNYANRPPMCRDFPWYGEPADETKSIPANCSYSADVPVQLGRKP